MDIDRFVRCCSKAKVNRLKRSWVIKQDIFMHAIRVSMHDVLMDSKIANRKSSTGVHVSFDTKGCISIQEWKFDEQKLVVSNHLSLTLVERHVEDLTSDQENCITLLSKGQVVGGRGNNFVSRVVNGNLLGALARGMPEARGNAPEV